MTEPTRPTARKTLAILEALERGERLTVATVLEQYDVYALSQECGRLRKLGWSVESDFIEVSPRVWVKQYQLNPGTPVSPWHPAFEKAMVAP